MDNLKEQTRQDLIEFFESEGGHTRVAEKIGLTPQTLRNVKIGRNDVTLAMLTALSKAYPENKQARALLARAVGLDTEIIDRPTHPPANGHPVRHENDTDEVIDLRQEVAVLKAENTLLRQENKKVWKLTLPKEVEEELNFLRSGSRITAVEVMDNAHERARIGYEYAKHLKSVDDEVQELIDQTLVIPIDSFDNVTPLWKQVEEKQA